MNWSWVGFFPTLISKRILIKYFQPSSVLRNYYSEFGRSVCISLSDAENIYLDYQHSTRDKNKGIQRFTVLFKVFKFRINNKLLLI